MTEPTSFNTKDTLIDAAKHSMERMVAEGEEFVTEQAVLTTNPRKDPEAAYEAFMSMEQSEWEGLCWSLLQGGVLEPAEQIGFDRALADRMPS